MIQDHCSVDMEALYSSKLAGNKNKCNIILQTPEYMILIAQGIKQAFL